MRTAPVPSQDRVGGTVRAGPGVLAHLGVVMLNTSAESFGAKAEPRSSGRCPCSATSRTTSPRCCAWSSTSAPWPSTPPRATACVALLL